MSSVLSQPPTTSSSAPAHNNATAPSSAESPKPNASSSSSTSNTSSSSHNEPLFATTLISPTVTAALPPNYTIRPLQRSDYAKGFLDVLRVLTSVGDISEARWNERYDWMHGREEYFILVVLDGGSDDKSSGSTKKESSTDSKTEGRIVGTGALVVERKFIHNLGMVGHIEDIAVARDQQGKKLGLRIIQALDFVAEKVGCYKSILDCSEANEGFYVKCGFRRAGLEMSHYYEAPKSKYEAS